MISDPAILQEIRDEWEVVRSSQRMVGGNIAFAFAFAGGGITSHAFRSFSFSLCVLFAFSVLEHTLLQLRDEGHFPCKTRRLGDLMDASRQSGFPWVNYALIDEARNRRNEIAHRRSWIEITDCLRYLDAIEAELRAWTILV